MKNSESPNTYKFIDNIDQWSVNRRKFIKAIGLATVVSQIGMLESCERLSDKDYEANQYLTVEQAETIQKVQETLFPDDGNGPGVESINAYGHFIWVLSDKRKDTTTKDYLVNGITWTNQTAMEVYNKKFSELSSLEIDSLIKKIASSGWGENWLSMILTLIFEALSLDPIYNINTNQEGWTWLEQYVGTPRPNVANSYNNIFKTINAK